MNPVAIVLLLAGFLTIAISRPLIQRRVKSNPWFGVRIPAAFASEQAWFAINEYGGRLLRAEGIGLVITAVVGGFFKAKYWVAYDCASLVLVVAGLGLFLFKIARYARAQKKA